MFLVLNLADDEKLFWFLFNDTLHNIKLHVIEPNYSALFIDLDDLSILLWAFFVPSSYIISSYDTLFSIEFQFFKILRNVFISLRIENGKCFQTYFSFLFFCYSSSPFPSSLSGRWSDFFSKPS